MTPYDRLKQLGLELPTPAVPVANYVPFVFANGFLYLSGQGPRKADGSQHTGKVGADVSLEQAYLHAQLTGLNLLSVAHLALGDLGRVLDLVGDDALLVVRPDERRSRRQFRRFLRRGDAGLGRSAGGRRDHFIRCGAGALRAEINGVGHQRFSG